MASQITHIVLSEKVFPKYFSSLSKRDFFIGTCFPDIRYLGVIRRNQTHVAGITLDDVLAETNSFMAGLKFHSLVDETREDFITNEGAYKLFPLSQVSMAAFKVLEDETFVSRINDWFSIAEGFNEVLQEERDFPIDPKQIKRWHGILQDLFRSNADMRVIERVLTELIDQATARAIIVTVHRMRASREILNIEKQFYQNIESLLEAKTP